MRPGVLRLARIGWLCGLVFGTIGIGACATPTLPLPPPAMLTVSMPVDGIVTVTGEVLPDAYVYCLNLDTDQGVFLRADEMGRFTLQIPALSGHYLSVWQEARAQRGPPANFPVP
jgi:hypothetical protein